MLQDGLEMQFKGDFRELSHESYDVYFEVANFTEHTHRYMVNWSFFIASGKPIHITKEAVKTIPEEEILFWLL